MCAQVKSKFQVAWVDPTDPTKGFKYIYLNPADYATLAASSSVVAHKVTVPKSVPEPDAGGASSPVTEEHYVVTDIIGSAEDLGVENLRGSATIAGEVCVCVSGTAAVGRTLVGFCVATLSML